MDGQFWVDERKRTSPVENRPGRDRPKCDTTTDKHDPPSLACGIPRCGEAVDAPGRHREKKLPSTRRAARASAADAPKRDERTDGRTIERRKQQRPPYPDRLNDTTATPDEPLPPTGPTGPPFRANPSPEVTDPICRLPLTTLS